MKTPENVKINGIDYAIKLLPQWEMGKHTGFAFSWTQQIHLTKESTPIYRAQDLLHEIIHLISSEYLGEMDSNGLDEAQVVALTAGLFNVLGSCGINLIDMVNEGLE